MNATIEEYSISGITPLLYAIDNTYVFTDDLTFDYAVERKCIKICLTEHALYLTKTNWRKKLC